MQPAQIRPHEESAEAFGAQYHRVINHQPGGFKIYAVRSGMIGQLNGFSRPVISGELGAGGVVKTRCRDARFGPEGHQRIVRLL